MMLRARPMEAAAITGATKSAVDMAQRPLKSIGSHIWARMSYLVKCEAKVDELKERVDSLQLEKKDLETIIDNAHREYKVASETTKKWISDVQNLASQADDLVMKCKGKSPSRHDLHDVDITQNRGEFKNEATDKRKVRNPIRRVLIGSLATKLLQEVEELLQRRNNLDVLVPCERPENSVTPQNNVMEFSSRNEAVNLIRSALNEDKGHVISVYGPRGIGKSLLVAEILRKMEAQETFHEVVTVDLGKKPGPEDIRNSIAHQLRIPTALLEQTLNDRKPVVFLDNVWESLDLGMLGIPVDQCKVIVTTQKIGVCKNPYASVEVTVDFLTEQESWELFKSKAGLAETYGTESVGQKIAKRCGRLPVALDVIGTALHGKDKMYRESVMLELESSNRLDKDEVIQKIYNPLESSYNHLEGTGTQYLFLMCSLFPGGHKISEEELSRYWIGLKKFPTMMQSRARIHIMLRDVVVIIASREDGQFAAPHEIDDERINERLKKCERVSLINTNIDKLPAPESPKLQLLLLRNNSDLHILPENFFECMQRLVVLDMTDSFIQSLPFSTKHLTELKTFCLDNSKVSGRTWLLGKLENLRVLSLAGSSIDSLPEELGGLEKLRLLDLSSMESLEIPLKLIPKLRHLEELYIGSSKLRWVTRVKSHRKNLYVKGVTFIRSWVVDALLEETEDLILESCLVEESPLTALNLLSRFRDLKILRLTKCNGLTHFFWCDDQNPQTAFHNLEELHITQCDRLRAVFHFQSTNENLPAFPCLKIIRLNSLQETVSIWSWEGNPPPHICSNLKELHVQSCNELKYVFVVRVASMLSDLKKLILKSNKAMKEIVASDETVGSEIVSANTRYAAHSADAGASLDPEAFSSLTHLSLVDLPEMEFFYKVRDEIMRFSWKSLVSLKLGGCNTLKGFPLHGESSPELKNIELVNDSDKSWYQTLVSQDASLAERFKHTQE
uniref:AAA+ ATPase domain-containing protein n=1 Tax=Leersia perrieri TaxID=77586 RepID=A0A0D9XS17_9ORYZ